MRWTILTGEYPPQYGGVSDYSRMVAEALATIGDVVDIIAPVHSGSTETSSSNSWENLRVHRLAHGFDYRDFTRIEKILSTTCPDRILLQYVPHAFGWKGMNVPLARWMHSKLSKRLPVDVMFHEVAYPFSWYPLRYALLARATAYMARQIASAADRIFVSIPAWGEIIHKLCPQAATAVWLPISNNMPTFADPREVSALRDRYGGDGGEYQIVGHFGTYGDLITRLLTPVLENLLARNSDVRVLLFGRGSSEYRDQFATRWPGMSQRIHAAGAVPAESVAAHIRACDLMLQPYPDGISSRRSSVMPALAEGVAVVSNLGILSEPLWRESGIAVAPSPEATTIAQHCITLLANDDLRRSIARRGQELYSAHFCLERTIKVLRDHI